MRKQTLPVAEYVNGKWFLDEPHEPNNRITCEAYGVMDDGAIVWEDSNGKQYTRARFFGKFYFCKM